MYSTVIILAVMTAIVSYLIGSINFSVILSRRLGGEDIRKTGSGNAGATNMLRRYGLKMALITLVLDILKGIAAILIARAVTDHFAASPEMTDTLYYASLPYMAGLFVVIGHDFPLYFGFRGGKGVATSLGVLIMLDWKMGLLIGICSIAVMALTRYVSLGSILGGAAFAVGETVGILASGDIVWVRLICSVALGALLIWSHRENIGRLMRGEENKLGEKKEAEKK